MLLALAMAARRLYIAGDGDGQRDPRQTSGHAAARGRDAQDPVAGGTDRPRHGLDRPFFDDKNRAFWILQSIGWSGYFFLRSLSGFANSMGWIFLVHTLLLTATGYSLTLLMASLYRRLIRMKPIWTLVLSLRAVVLASRRLLSHRDLECCDVPQADSSSR